MCVCWKLSLGPLEEQYVVLTVELALQLSNLFLYILLGFNKDTVFVCFKWQEELEEGSLLHSTRSFVKMWFSRS